MVTFLTHLPREAYNQRYSILAPHGDLEISLEQLLHDFLEGKSISIDLTIFRDDIVSRLRVIPEAGMIVQDPGSLSVYHIDRGIGFFIDEDGGITDNMVDVSGFINIEVTASHTPAGFLILWYTKDISEEIHETTE